MQQFFQRPENTGAHRFVLKIQSPRDKSRRMAPYIIPRRIWNPKGRRKADAAIPGSSVVNKKASVGCVPYFTQPNKPKLRRSSPAAQHDLPEELKQCSRSAQSGHSERVLVPNVDAAKTEILSLQDRAQEGVSILRAPSETPRQHQIWDKM